MLFHCATHDTSSSVLLMKRRSGCSPIIINQRQVSGSQMFRGQRSTAWQQGLMVVVVRDALKDATLQVRSRTSQLIGGNQNLGKQRHFEWGGVRTTFIGSIRSFFLFTMSSLASASWWSHCRHLSLKFPCLHTPHPCPAPHLHTNLLLPYYVKYTCHNVLLHICCLPYAVQRERSFDGARPLAGTTR
jgi:hypothetical protein